MPVFLLAVLLVSAYANAMNTISSDETVFQQQSFDNEETQVFAASDDSCIRQGDPNNPLGDHDEMNIRDEGYFESRWSGIIKFDISSLPDDVEIISAELNMYYHRYSDNNPVGRPLTLHHVLEDWDEESVCWDNQPAFSTVFCSLMEMPPTASQWLTWDVSEEIESIMDGEKDNFGWLIQDLTPTGYDSPITRLSTKEYGSNEPYLEICYEIPIPDPPQPPLITGPTTGTYGEEQTYTFIEIYDNPDEDFLIYVDWGDGTAEEWVGSYSPNAAIEINHTWDEQDTYMVKAKVKDSYDQESDWATLEIAIPRNQEYTPSESTDLEDGLVAYLSFDELDEGLVPDESMYGNYGDIDCSGQCEAPAGFGMHFDGDDDSIVIDDDESINFEDTNAMSISLWIKRDQISSGHSEKLVSKSFTSTGRGYGLNIYEDNCIRFTIRTGTERLDIDSLEKIDDTEWHHIVATWDQGVETLYIDGELDSSVDHGSHTIANEYKDLELGLHYGWNSPFGGSMDEFRLYERVLSADEAKELYENPSDFEQMLFIGKISGYDDNIGNLRILHAEKLRVIQFGPFGYNVKTGQEKIKLSDSFIGYTGASFIFGIGSGRIYS